MTVMNSQYQRRSARHSQGGVMAILAPGVPMTHPATRSQSQGQQGGAGLNSIVMRRGVQAATGF
jgi:hypothetical protein